MKSRILRPVYLVLLVLLAALSWSAAARAAAAQPAWTKKQVEADWLRQDKLRSAKGAPTSNRMTAVIERGRQLAGDLERMGADVSAQRKELEAVAAELAAPGPGAPEPLQEKLYLRARWAVRKLSLSNPLLDFDDILFVKRQPTTFPHVCDQYYGWWSRPGGGICILSGLKGGKPTVRCITEGWAAGNFLRPMLSYDGKKVLFAYCKYHPALRNVRDKTKKDKLPEDGFYHVFEMNIDGSGKRRLTRGRYDDFDARYLPNGDIVFLSTRKGTALQAGKRSAQATCRATTPDSFVRCGGGNHRPVAVFTLHRMDGNGGNLRAISAFENFEWTPAIAWDGRVLYARWDYIDRFNGHFMSLWSTNPDGTNAQLVYGNYTKRPQCVFEARPIPRSNKLVFTATAHHSITGGSLVLLDRARGTEFDAPITRLTPEVRFPETEGWPTHYYHGPWPLSEDHYLVGWADSRLPPHSCMRLGDARNPGNACGIYLYDAFGNLTLLHRDPKISSMNPIPLRPRRVPLARPDSIAWDGPQEGRFLLQDVYRGLDGIARGQVKSLRIVGVLPKVQPQMNRPALGVSREDPGKFVLGTVPVEEDGSAYFRVPSGIPYFFQALDADGMAVQTMRTLTYVQPGTTLSCVGCHEARDMAAVPGRPRALDREPSRITLEPAGSWPLRYDRLVQPILDRHCVRCHKPGSKKPKAAKFDLTPRRSYHNLIRYAGGELRKLAHERDSSPVGQCAARNSKIIARLTNPKAKGHEGLKLDKEGLRRLIVWMDVYAHIRGAFSSRQEAELEQLKADVAGLLAR
jgi:hypothetical protein